MAKIEEINSNPKLLAGVPREGSANFINFLWDLSGGPSKFSEPLQLISQTDDGLSFREGLNISSDMSKAVMHSPQYGNGIPASIVYRKDNHIVEHVLPKGNLNYSVVVYLEEKQILCRLMDRSLANSMMIKLFYFDGEGLKNFELIKTASDLTGRTRIKVFKVLWDIDPALN